MIITYLLHFVFAEEKTQKTFVQNPNPDSKEATDNDINSMYWMETFEIWV